MKTFKFNINGNAYEVDITSIEEGVAQLTVNGDQYEVQVDKSLNPVATPKPVTTRPAAATVQRPAAPKAPGAPAAMAAPATTLSTGAGTGIKSPLPGVILEVAIKVGDEVKAGQKLIILEAMKMENNINADRDGKIAAVKVAKGDSVMEGDTLVVIE